MRRRTRTAAAVARTAVVSAVAAALAVTAPCASAQPATVWDIAFDDLSPIDFFASPLVVDGPTLTGFEGPKAIIELTTSVPTPPVVVRYGPYFEAGGVEEPAFRKVAVERAGGDEETWTHHRVAVDFSRLESPLYDETFIPEGGGVVACRIEVLDPEYSAVRTLERRYRYTRSGPPKTGEYRRAETLTLGPFVDLVEPHSFVISWETDGPAPGAVIVGEELYAAPEPATRHEIEVPDREPETKYEYRVRYGTDEAETRAYRATTAPPPGASGFRFGFASDSRAGAGGGEHAIEGVNHACFTDVLHGAVANSIDLLLFGGDLVDGYTSSSDVHERQLDSWKRAASQVGFSLPIYQGVGNHEQVGDYFEVPDPENEGSRIIMFRDRDDPASAESIFSRSFTNPRGSCYGFGVGPETRTASGKIVTGPDYGETVYSFNYGNCHFVSVNSNYWFTGIQMGDRARRYPSDKDGTAVALEVLGGNREGYLLPNQLGWLAEDLKFAQADEDIDWIFLFTHEPAFPNGGHLWDAMFWGDAGKGHEGGLNDPSVPLGDVVDMRNRFWQLLARHDKVVAFLCGDEHNYSRTIVDAEVDPSFTRPVWHIVSGGAGAPFYVQDTSVPWSDKVEAFFPVNHYCTFDVGDDRVSLTVYSTAGVIIDEVPNLAGYAGARAGTRAGGSE